MIAKLRFLFWLGIITIFVPYFGITDGIRKILTIIIGALVIYLAIRLRKEYKSLKYLMRKMEQPETVIETTSNASEQQ